MEEIDIWRAAKQMIDRHGEDAEIAASMRADSALEQGDQFNVKLWMRVAAAVRELERKRREGEPLN